MPWRDTDIQIEGPAVGDFQKLFLTPGRDRRAQNFPKVNTSRTEGRGECPGEGAGQLPGGGQQAHFYYVYSRHHLCREFALYDKCLFCP